MESVICITGMHRSGTSLTASWLQKCGLKIENGKLYGSTPGNIKGHFEDVDFVNLHAQCIMQEIPKSKGWIVYNSKFSFSEREITKAKKLISERKNYGVWGWKDPRSVLFLKDWVELIPNLKFIFLWRPATQVVDSLLTRQQKSTNPDFQINKIKAFKTWVWYNKQFLEFYKKHPENCILTSIEQVINDDNKLLEFINKKFNLELNYFPIEKIFEERLFSHPELIFTDKVYSKFFRVSGIEHSLDRLSTSL